MSQIKQGMIKRLRILEEISLGLAKLYLVSLKTTDAFC